MPVFDLNRLPRPAPFLCTAGLTGANNGEAGRRRGIRARGLGRTCTRRQLLGDCAGWNIGQRQDHMTLVC